MVYRQIADEANEQCQGIGNGGNPKPYTANCAEFLRLTLDFSRRRIGGHPDDKQAVIHINAEAMFSMVDNLFKGINILSWMVGLGTLLAGAIGVSNIMMVTVKERTTEIGIRRAIGARPRDIMNQILSESMVLTSLAGMMGICFAVFVLQMMEMGTAQSDTPGHFQISFWYAQRSFAHFVLMFVAFATTSSPNEVK